METFSIFASVQQRLQDPLCSKVVHPPPAAVYSFFLKKKQGNSIRTKVMTGASVATATHVLSPVVSAHGQDDKSRCHPSLLHVRFPYLLHL